MSLWLNYALWSVWSIYLILVLLSLWVSFQHKQNLTLHGKATFYIFLTATPFWICWNIWG